jgi:DNA-binding MarR family transcriptional regulator
MEDQSRQRVGLVPIAIFQHPDCGCEEQGIYGFMSTHACRRGYLWLGLATIAEAVKLDRGKVRRRLEKMTALGFVERLPHPDPAIRCWMYRLKGHAHLIDGLLREDGGPKAGLSQNSAAERVSVASERHDEHEHFEHLTEDSLSGAIPRAAGEPDMKAGKGLERGEPVAPEPPVPLSPEWTPSEADLAFAGTARSDLTASDVAAVTTKFVRRYGGQRLPDPSSIFRSWIKREIKSDVHRARHRTTGSSTGDTARTSPRTGPRLHDPRGIAERNRAAADDCLRRILARRTEHLSS